MRGVMDQTGGTLAGDCNELEHLRAEARRARQGILEAGEGGRAMAALIEDDVGGRGHGDRRPARAGLGT